MRNVKGILLVLVLLVPFVVGCAGTSESTRPSEAGALQKSPSVVVIPSSGKPAAKIAVLGAGFVPGEEVQIEVDMSGVTLFLGSKEAAHVANEMGAIKIDSFIPGALVAKGGLYTVKAVGNKGSFATYPLEVIEEKKEKK
jgi:hypothetical protein